MLERISENLSEAMQNKVAFRIPIFGGIPVPVSCVVTWIIMAILVIASILLTRNLKLIPDIDGPVAALVSVENLNWR